MELKVTLRVKDVKNKVQGYLSVVQDCSGCVGRSIVIEIVVAMLLPFSKTIGLHGQHARSTRTGPRQKKELLFRQDLYYLVVARETHP